MYRCAHSSWVKPSCPWTRFKDFTNFLCFHLCKHAALNACQVTSPEAQPHTRHTSCMRVCKLILHVFVQRICMWEKERWTSRCNSRCCRATCRKCIYKKSSDVDWLIIFLNRRGNTRHLGVYYFLHFINGSRFTQHTQLQLITPSCSSATDCWNWEVNPE